MPLRKADRTNTRRFEDEGAWIVLRTELTTGERQRIRDLSTASHYVPQNGTPVAELTPEQVQVEVYQRVSDAQPYMFEILCDSWSLGEVSAQAYRELDEESGEWVDECMVKVLEERRKRAEKNGQSSTKPESSESSSDVEDSPSSVPSP